jgi:mannose-6-phosphate isomerase-like protein (cupin superfamily)
MSYSNNFYGREGNRPTESTSSQIKDYGPYPLVANMEKAAMQNTNFRTALWTGKHLQVTLMSLRPGDDIGLENHPHTDQYLMVMDGKAKVMMGKTKDNLNFTAEAYPDYAIIVPANTWHNLVNIGHTPLKLFSIYAPPEHPFGTVHRTKAEAEEAEKNKSAQPASAFIYSVDE